MRLIHIDKLTADMKLAKDVVYQNNRKLLVQGCTNINKYSTKLKNLGINYVYIDDEISKGIEIKEVVTQETKDKSKIVIEKTIKNITLNKQPNMTIVKDSISNMLEEILNNKQILLNLTDIKNNDDYTFLHSVNVAVISLVIGKLLNYDKEKMMNLGTGALLHDIGKAFIPPEILNKPDKLTDEEFEIMKQHTTLGYEVLKNNSEINPTSRIIILTHHEKVDGSGYPLKLKGNDLHEFAKIIAIADVFDALTSDRVYRPKWPTYEAIEYLISLAGTHFDVDLIKIFTQNVAAFPNGTLVKLSTGETGIIINQNKDFPNRPLVKIIKDKDGNSIDKIINLMKEISIIITKTDI